jgi:hypothetical protein
MFIARHVQLTAKKSQMAPATTSASRRMPDGHPDIQGIWSYGTITPLERPRELGGKEVFTDEEAADTEKRQLQNRDIPDRWDAGLGVIKDRRTSLIRDPPNGRLPPLTPQGQNRVAALAETLRHPAARPEDRGPRERCIVRSGPPILPDAYSNVVQVFQTSEYVGILTELIHDARIVPLGNKPHLNHNIRQWMGDSRGHWEGDTLVVDTTNFTDKTSLRGAGEGLHVIERFTRIDADTLQYEFTVDDPQTWTRPWTAALPMTKSRDQIIEYACHEGNYTNMSGILSAARAEDRAAGQSQGGGPK